ncbi:TolC family protein [Nitrospira sp. NS4]|uniref:TolC family protein n=1 Tax=Nitrospira sp. NS4 TaxID=3414498 RepID=UPI003C2F2B62
MPQDKSINAFSCLASLLVFIACSGTTSLAAETRSSSPLPANGAPLTWERAIQLAIEKQPLIKVAEHEALESQALVKQIESANYPQVTGIYSSSGGNTRVLANLGISGSLPKPTNYLTTPGIRVDLLITDFGQTAHRILSQKSLAASAEQAVMTAKALTILNVEQAYLNCLKQQRLVDIAREVMNERELIRQQTEAFYRRDLRSKLDLDFASVEANRAEVVLIKAQNNLVLAFSALNTAMGFQGRGDYLLDQPVRPATPNVSPETLVQEALNQRPELLGSKDRIQAAEEALQAARALRFGSVTGIGTAGYTWWGREENPAGNGVVNPGAQLGWYGLGVTSAVPLYTGGRIEGQIEEADARRGETQAATRSIANDIVLQVAQAYLGRLTAEQQIKVSEEKVAHAREALTLARERYKAGLGSILDVTTATTDLLSAEVGLAEALYDFRASEAALAYATGAEYARY